MGGGVPFQERYGSEEEALLIREIEEQLEKERKERERRERQEAPDTERKATEEETDTKKE